MEVVINKCIGGFGISNEAEDLYLKLSGKEIDQYDIDRNDPLLVQVVRELGDKANTNYAKLSIVEIPDDIEWEISNYDGIESVGEKHRSWS